MARGRAGLSSKLRSRGGLARLRVELGRTFLVFLDAAEAEFVHGRKLKASFSVSRDARGLIRLDERRGLRRGAAERSSEDKGDGLWVQGLA